VPLIPTSIFELTSHREAHTSSFEHYCDSGHSQKRDVPEIAVRRSASLKKITAGSYGKAPRHELCQVLLSLRSRLDRLPLKPAGRPIHAVQDFADFHRVNSALPRAGEIRDDIPVEAGEAQNLALEEAFLIAVGAESQRTVLDVGCRTNAITLDSFAA